MRRSLANRAETVLEEAAEDILAYRHLPVEHQRQLHSANPLEVLSKKIKRRSNVVFPSPAVIRLVGAILLEQDDEWAVAERRYFSAESMNNGTAAPFDMHGGARTHGSSARGSGDTATGKSP